MRIVFHYFLHEVQLKFKPTQGFNARHDSVKIVMSESTRTNEIHASVIVQFSSENAYVVR